jgi:signal transduction histidine kinase
MRVARGMTVRRGVADGLLGALLVVVQFGTAVALAGSWGGTSWLLDLVTGLFVGALVLGRRSRPAQCTVAAGVVASGSAVLARVAHLPHEPGPATVLGLAVLLSAAVRRLEPRRAAVPAGFGLAVVVAAAGTSRTYGSELDVITVLAALGWLTAVAAGLGLRLRDAQRRAVLDEVRRVERLDLARELHDLAAHHLTGLVLQAQAARIVARKDATRLDETLADIEGAGADALTAMRRVVGLLRDSADSAPMLPGAPLLAELVRNFAARLGAPLVTASLDDADLPPAMAGTVHRIIQEALTNVVRHAPLARTVTVDVRVADGEVTVSVTNDGPAAAPGRGGFGLIGMAERVTALGGEVTAGPLTAGSITAGPVTGGPVAGGPVTAGPVTAGPVSASPGVGGAGVAGPGVGGAGVSGPGVGGAAVSARDVSAGDGGGWRVWARLPLAVRVGP